MLLGGLAQALVTPISGAVIDARDGAIRGAAVELVCADRVVQTAATNSGGRFRLASVAMSDDCHLAVSADGFATAVAPISGDRNALIVRLQIAPRQESIVVSGRAPAEDGGGVPARLELSRSDLLGISNDTADILRYVETLAGSRSSTGRIYVDGVPAASLPAAAFISRIVVGADAFDADSADPEDGDRIDIITEGYDRTFHVGMNGAMLPVGRKNVLAADLSSSSTSVQPTLSGSIPWLPLTFRVAGERSEQTSQLFIAAAPAGQTPAAVSRAALHAVTLDVNYAHGSLRGGVFGSLSDHLQSNVGVGGITLAGTGQHGRFTSTELRVFFEDAGSRLRWQAFGTLVGDSTDLIANSPDQQIRVAGALISGGAAASELSIRPKNWTLKTVLESRTPERHWAIGVVARRASLFEHVAPNPNGVLAFESVSSYQSALDGDGEGLLTLTSGVIDATRTSMTIAPFFETELIRFKTASLKAGVREDYQSGAGAMTSPRISGSASFAGFRAHAGAGLFVDSLPDDALLQVEAERNVRRQLAISPVGPGTASNQGTDALVDAEVAPGFVRPRSVVARVGASRQLADFEASVDYGWSRADHLAGSRRIPEGAGWLDVTESNRHRTKEEARARVQYRRSKQLFACAYSWIRSYDDTDGPLSFAEHFDDLTAEWGRSTGIPASSGSLIASLTGPGAVRLMLLGTWTTGAPYTITSGRDLAFDGLFSDRGGRSRNDALLPGTKLVSAYLSRRWSMGILPRAHARGARMTFDAGLRADNVFDTRNYTTVGSVSGSPLFGRPLAAQPGRSLQLWFTVGS